jgi:quercetin dioxygenase-like cupin family protein
VGPVVTTVALDDVDAIPLPGDSWSRMLITDVTTQGNASSLGYSVFRPGSVVGPVSHATEEVAYVVAGTGELQLDDGPVAFRAGQAVHIPAGVWHAVANTGETDVIMVFGFAAPAYPPTERRTA